MNDTASKPDSTDHEDTTASAPEAEVPTSAEQMPETAAPEATAEVVPEPELTLEEQLEQSRAETAAAKEAHLRAVADLENFRRRSIREKDDLRAYATANVVEELMPVLDNLGFALTAARADNAELKSLADGVEMVGTQFKTALGNHGLKEVNPTGETFDPNQHDALSEQASDDIAEGNVIQVVRIGYSLNGRLLRPASVIVSGGAAAPEPSAEI